MPVVGLDMIRVGKMRNDTVYQASRKTLGPVDGALRSMPGYAG